jgi:hypothetical protein
VNCSKKRGKEIIVSLYFVLAILDYYIMVDPMGTRYPPETRRVWVRV